MAIRMPWAGGPDPEDALALGAFDAGFRGSWAWEQPVRFRHRWRLTCDGAAVATLATHGLFLSPTTARFADATWEVRLRFPAAAVVTRAGEAEPWGHYRSTWPSGGRVTRERQPELLWRREGFWGLVWSFTTADHIPLVRFRSRHTFLRYGATVELADAARRLDDLPALLALGWTLLLRRHRSHAAHAGAH
jgi:hypothetical protein